jgi:molybdenum cofactor biosynthesis enzyme MoaA
LSSLRNLIREALSDAPLRAVEKDLDSLEEEQFNEVSPPGYEYIVKVLKKKYKKNGDAEWKKHAYMTAWKMYNENK